MTLQRNGFQVWAFGKALKFSSWLQRIPNKLTPPPFRIMQIGSLYWQSRALYMAAKLDIANALDSGEMRVEELADVVGTQTGATFRLMRMLVAIGVFREVSPHVFANNALSDCLRDDNRNNIRPMVLMHNSPEMSSAWFEELEAGLVSGEIPFQLANRAPLFEYMSSHPEFDRLFAQAMDRVESLTDGDVLVDDFDWAQFDRVIDIGGSKGSKAIAILNKHKHLSALVVDRPQVIEDAQIYWSDRVEEAVLSRITFEPADIRMSVPQAQSDNDVFMLNAVLHGLDDETCIAILVRLRDACAGTEARIVVTEILVPETGADLTTASFDMQMFIGTAGRERTRQEFQYLFEKAGLQGIENVKTRSFASMMVLGASA